MNKTIESAEWSVFFPFPQQKLVVTWPSFGYGFSQHDNNPIENDGNFEQLNLDDLTRKFNIYLLSPCLITFQFCSFLFLVSPTHRRRIH
jgi:hypothetical protein